MVSRRHLDRTIGLVSVILAVAALLLFPQVARADGYSIESVDIDATVARDGSVSVRESRRFDFDGSYHGVYWKIPTGSFDGRDIMTSIDTVGEMVDGTFVAFERAESGAEHTYELSDYGSYIRVKLYSAHSHEDATFVIGYTDTSLAVRHEDVGELYWKFVSDGWDEESQDVTCTVHLPVPEGRTIVPEEDVRAWGHGPLDASVGFEGNDVVYRVPGVGTSEFAEARITFPSSWLGEAPTSPGKVLPSILEEEQRWADEANAKRERARAVMLGGLCTSAAGTLATLVIPLLMLVRYRRSHKPQFDDDYFRDVPSDDHPAVLAALYNDGTVPSTAFTATLMRLTDLKAIRLELVTLRVKGFLGREKERQDYRLTLRRKAKGMELGPIDRSALTLVFEKVGRYADQPEGERTKQPSLCFSEVAKVAKKYPERFSAAYDNWESKVKAEVARRQFFKGTRPTGRAAAVACAVGAALLLAGTFVFMFVTEAWAPCLLLMLLQVVALVASISIAVRLKSVSDEAIELRAQLKGLHRWLKDFTRLGEAVPRDVVLWNRLLVMAVVFGVADEVIRQLKVVAPEVLSDPALTSTYGWFYAGPNGRPYERFTDSYATAHSVSTAALSSSDFSSGGGGGGGFSGGGGGGFGGGGGGGAF